MIVAVIASEAKQSRDQHEIASGRYARLAMTAVWQEGQSQVTTAPWRPPRGLDRARLKVARLEAHYAAQWLARATRAYFPPQPNDGHTNLGWDDGFGGLVTHPAEGVRLGLRIA